MPAVVFPPLTPFTCHVTLSSVVPLTVAVKVAVRLTRTTALAGDTVTETGTLAITETLYAAEICPSGFKTVTGTDDPVADVEPDAVNRDAETKLVASETPARRTTAPFRNPLPFTVKVKVPAVSGLGVTEEIDGAGYLIVTVAVPLTVGMDTDVARMVTAAGEGTEVGAVYKPNALTVPVYTVPGVTSLTAQMTDWSVDPSTTAANCRVPPVSTVAEPGVTVTDAPGCFAWPELGSTIRDYTSTASKAEPVTLFSLFRVSLFQRESGSPEMNQAEPLSAIIMPYFFRARRITCTSAG